MGVSDLRYATELVTKKGRAFKFDDVSCMIAYLKTGVTASSEIKTIYFTDFSTPSELINVEKSFLLKSDLIRGPMGGNLIALKEQSKVAAFQKKYNGTITTWEDLIR